MNESAHSSATPPPLPTPEEQSPLSAEGNAPVFFPVSVLKLIVMSIATFGVYELVWFYWNWKYVRRALGRSDVMPFWRAVFSYFFCLPLLREIRQLAALRGLTQIFHPGWCALGWVGAYLCANLPDPYWLLSVLAPLALVPAQNVINRLNAHLPAEALNRKFSVWNIIAIGIGGLLTALIIVATFLPEELADTSEQLEISAE